MDIVSTGEDSFEIDGIEYVCCPFLRGGFPSTPGRFCLVKPRATTDAYVRLLRDLAPRRVVEVGVADGASLALAADVARPEKLVGIDRRDGPTVAIDDFIAQRGMGDTVSVHWGVDQVDAARLGAIMDSEFGGAALDLVVDDASHLLSATRYTFNALFPRLRAGGTYLIEDWWWAHADPSESLLPGEVPLTVLIFELLLACAYKPGVVSAVAASRDWALVTRGSEALAPQAFDLATCYGPRGRALIADL